MDEATTQLEDRHEDTTSSRFSRAMLVSGIRCLLTYIVFPWLLPALGWASGVGPSIALPIGLLAIGFNIDSIRRFRTSKHRMRIPVILLNMLVIALLVLLIVQDLQALF